MKKSCRRCKCEFETINRHSKCCEQCLIKKCIICNAEFKDYTNQTCSQPCFHKLLKIKVSEIHKKEDQSIRYSRIKESNKTKLTDLLISSIEKILELSYIKDPTIISKLASNNKHSGKLLKQYIEKFPEEWNNYKEKMFPGPLTKKVQTLKPEQFQELLNDLKYYSYNHNLSKWNLDPKTQKRLFDFYIKTNDFISKKESFPEKQIRRILENENIDYKREVCFNGSKHRVDFLITGAKKVIEVNGDFWHANPKIYGTDENKYSKLQLQSLLRYKDKMLYLKENGYTVLEIWENDIDLYYEEIKQKIIKYAKNNN